MAELKYYPGEPKEYSFKKLFEAINQDFTSNSGKSVQSGDASKDVFVITHGLGAIPGSVVVTAGSADAAGSFYVSADATHVTVTYTTAPAAGTDNVTLFWQVSK